MTRFDDDEARSNRTNQETSRAALERYLFYCNRFSSSVLVVITLNSFSSCIED